MSGFQLATIRIAADREDWLTQPVALLLLGLTTDGCCDVQYVYTQSWLGSLELSYEQPTDMLVALHDRYSA